MTLLARQSFWRDPWRLMLAVNAAAMVGVFIHKITLPPYVPYIHLLVDYHFGFAKRALIGELVSLFAQHVPVWLVFALGGATWLVTASLFVTLFRRTFGFDDAQLPLFVFTAGSPFFFKNFMHTLGHFDIYGCLFAIVLLLIPAEGLGFIVLALSFSILLILIHHIHLLMYVPTIALIVIIRHHLVGTRRTNLVTGIASLVLLGVLFLALQFWGAMRIPENEFVAYLKTRMADPARIDLLSFSYIWYRTLPQEFADTWARMPSNLLGVPVFALLIWLHAPLWRYFAELVRSLASDLHRRIVLVGIAIVCAAYLIMFATVFDYSRWVSNWMVCLFLVLHAVKTLPAAKVTPPISATDQKANILGWIVTLIPRVGVIRPF